MHLFLSIENFLKAKWVLYKPKNKKYLIYDYAHSNYLFKYIKKKECEIYYQSFLRLFLVHLLV